ncbi:MAG: hypothetical protein KDK51_10440, partial [Deltaproteobacteria bacterium]|nr:hypothetical protein [Deltaproteobacteria bacterium]
MGSELFGKTAGLSKKEETELLRLYRRKIPTKKIITWELGKQLAQLSHKLDRNIGVMVDRRGYIEDVAIGTNFDIDFPLKTRLRATSTRLSGYRAMFTKLNNKAFSKKEKNMLYDRRLDAICSIEIEKNGSPGAFHIANLHPEASGFDSIVEDTYNTILDIDIPFDEWVDGLEDEFQKIIQAAYIIEEQSKAVLCYLVTPENRHSIEDEIEETLELSKTAGLKIVKTVSQHRSMPDPRYFYGKGKAKDLVQEVISENADMILFHQDLS